jgi:hypothetical protein
MPCLSAIAAICDAISFVIVSIEDALNCSIACVLILNHLLIEKEK